MNLTVRNFALSVIALMLSVQGAMADPKPKGAKNADPQVIANHYAGKTVLWSSCKAGIYFGGKWQAQSYCEKGKGSVGFGKWSITGKGALCYDMTYYWPDGSDVGSEKKGTECMRHLVDPGGQLWVKWDGHDGWWPVKKDGVAKGFKYKSKVKKMRKKLGV